MILEFYSGVLTGMIIIAVLVGKSRWIAPVHKDMTCTFDDRTYRLVEMKCEVKQ
jgi:hypothetical protein